MADDVDRATAIADASLARSIAAARQPVPAGVPGVCEECGGDSLRLVRGCCAPCRDKVRR